MTFLDLVRKVGELSRDRCHPDCDLGMHRQEAARHLGLLLENPDLLRELTARPPAGGADLAAVLAELVECYDMGIGIRGRRERFEEAWSRARALVEAAQSGARAASGERETLAHRLSRSGSSGYVKVGAGLTKTIAEAEHALERGEVSTLDEVLAAAPPAPDAHGVAALLAECERRLGGSEFPKLPDWMWCGDIVRYLAPGGTDGDQS